MLKPLPGLACYPVKRGGAVALTAYVQDHVMGARDRVDTIELHEPQIVDQRCQVIAFAKPGRAGRQQMVVQKQAAGLGVGQAG